MLKKHGARHNERCQGTQSGRSDLPGRQVFWGSSEGATRCCPGVTLTFFGACIGLTAYGTFTGLCSGFAGRMYAIEAEPAKLNSHTLRLGSSVGRAED